MFEAAAWIKRNETPRLAATTEEQLTATLKAIRALEMGKEKRLKEARKAWHDIQDILDRPDRDNKAITLRRLKDKAVELARFYKKSYSLCKRT